MSSHKDQKPPGCSTGKTANSSKNEPPDRMGRQELKDVVNSNIFYPRLNIVGRDVVEGVLELGLTFIWTLIKPIVGVPIY